MLSQEGCSSQNLVPLQPPTAQNWGPEGCNSQDLPQGTKIWRRRKKAARLHICIPHGQHAELTRGQFPKFGSLKATCCQKCLSRRLQFWEFVSLRATYCQNVGPRRLQLSKFGSLTAAYRPKLGPRRLQLTELGPLRPTYCHNTGPRCRSF